MTERVTILRLFHSAERRLLGDEALIDVIGWSTEQSLAALGADELAYGDNGVVRVLLAFHANGIKSFDVFDKRATQLVGFDPERIERETFSIAEALRLGARTELREAKEGDLHLMPSIYVLTPMTGLNEDLLRAKSRNVLYE